MHKGKQYSFWHKLPCNKETITTLIPRNILKKKSFLDEYNVKINFSILMFLVNKLVNSNKKENLNPIIEIKRSTLRNFIGKKIHSQSKNLLDKQVDLFLEKLSTAKTNTLYFEKKTKELVLFSFKDSFFQELKKGNTVSFNLLDFTSIRGEKAKKLFLNVLSFDMRLENRYMKFSNIVNLLSLEFKNRKLNIQFIKRALMSLSRKGFIEFLNYEVKSKISLYSFNYRLSSLLQK